MEDKNIAFPGDIIAIEEEYLPGKNTEEYGGNIYATVMGKVYKDDKNLVVSIIAENKKIKPSVGSIVYGKVIKVINKEAIIQISAVSLNNNIYPVNIESRLRLPVQNKNAYSHIITLGDMIRGRITGVKPLYLTIFSPNLGVLKTRCLVCRRELILRDDTLYCNNCQRSETRKIASDYGNINILGGNNEGRRES